MNWREKNRLVWVCFIVVSCVAVSCAMPERDSPAPPVDGHYRTLEALGEERAGEAVLEAIQKRGWSSLELADAAAKFEEGASQDSEDWIFAAELRLLSGTKNGCFRAAHDAWRWLAATGGGKGKLPDVRRRAYRIYNHAVAGYACSVAWNGSQDRRVKKIATEDRVIGRSVRLIRNGWLGEEMFDALLPSDLQDNGKYRTRVATSGVGGPVFAVFKRTRKLQERFPDILPADLAIPLTAVLDFRNGNAELELLDPGLGESVRLFDRKVPLKTDYTAPMAYMQTQLLASQIYSPIPSASDSRYGPQSGTGQLAPIPSRFYMLEPPRRDRSIVLFVHGLHSDPSAFRHMVHELMAYREIRQNFQFAAYQYPTDTPLLFNQIVFRERLAEWYSRLQGTPKIIVIGHSMGGLMAKPLVQSSGQILWDRVFTLPPDRVEMTDDDGRTLKSGLIFEPVPAINRMIFLAVPHRGSELAEGSTGAAAESMAVEDPEARALTDRLLRKYKSSLRPSVAKIAAEEKRVSVNNLRPHSTLISALVAIPISPKVPFHSVMGEASGNFKNPKGDGVVSYKSAHLDGAVSEKLVQWGHNVTSSPACIKEVARILIEHADEG